MDVVILVYEYIVNLVQLLTFNILQVISLGRREVPFEGDGIEKVEQKIIDFDNMDNFQNEFKGVHKVRKNES